jgi:hypothetical protein
MLYHYTTIDILALIVENKTLRFNSLLNVDDQDEGETSDNGSFKEHIFVSCWTDDSVENIALWNMYAKNMKGIRLGVDSSKIIFIPKETVQIPVYHIVENVKPQNKNTAFIIWYDTNSRGSLDTTIKVKYDLDKKYPFVLKKSEVMVQYNFEDLACRKRKEWMFQSEVRCVLFGASTINFKKNYSYQSIINSITSKENIDCGFVDLCLEESFFQNIEVLLGPSSTESDNIICKSLLNQYVGTGNYILKKSNLNIRQRGSN